MDISFRYIDAIVNPISEPNATRTRWHRFPAVSENSPSAFRALPIGRTYALSSAFKLLEASRKDLSKYVSTYLENAR